MVGVKQLFTHCNMKYLNHQDSSNIDLELINEYKYTMEQLTELSGMSCAHAISKCYELSDIEKRILICCGPGKKNGGRGVSFCENIFEKIEASAAISVHFDFFCKKKNKFFHYCLFFSVIFGAYISLVVGVCTSFGNFRISMHYLLSKSQ